MARIYTRGGDQGETALGNGSRTSKSGPRVDVYGEVDELISWVGHCAALGTDGIDDADFITDLHRDLVSIQNRLFSLASVMANPDLSAAETPAGRAHPSFDALHLEQRIDSHDAELPALTQFILPGGHPLSTALHLARVVCRRAERKAVALAAEAPVPPRAITYLNRLSDYLFVAARAVNQAAGVADQAWSQDEGAPA